VRSTIGLRATPTRLGSLGEDEGAAGNQFACAQEYVQSLNIQKRLRKHRGCVNTISFSADGRLLLSGSDDRTLVLWDWQEAAPALSFHTGHSNNVYHALFMPVSGDRSIVSCAADGEVSICYSFTWRCPCNNKFNDLVCVCHLWIRNRSSIRRYRKGVE